MTMDTQTIIILAAVAGVLLLAVLLLFGRRQRVTLSQDDARPLEKRSFAPRDTPAPAPVIEDANLEAAVMAPPPAADAVAASEGDPLTRIKGLGPKAAARLAELGITRFDQIAALHDAAADRLDAQMGAFRGRLARDRWVEQARLLAAGETAAFEAQFGKLG